MTGARNSAAERMLEIAVARIEADGMTVGIDHLRMEEVIEAAGVSRATAYRRWPRREDFLADVLVATVRRTSLLPETEDEVTGLVALLEEHAAALGTEQGRRDLVVEALRRAVDGDVRRYIDSPQWRTYLAISSAYQGLLDGRVREAVGEALVETEQTFTQRRAEIYANLAQLLGYRPAQPARDAYLELSSAAGSLMTGLVVRVIANPDWLDEREPLALYGASREADWSMPERHVVGLLLSRLEPDPDATWTAETIAARRAAFGAQVAELYGQATPSASR